MTLLSQVEAASACDHVCDSDMTRHGRYEKLIERDAYEGYHRLRGGYGYVRLNPS